MPLTHRNPPTVPQPHIEVPPQPPPPPKPSTKRLKIIIAIQSFLIIYLLCCVVYYAEEETTMEKKNIKKLGVCAEEIEFWKNAAGVWRKKCVGSKWGWGDR
jgi:hypothetical protein